MFSKLAVGGVMAAMAAMAIAAQTGRVSAQYPVPQGSCAISTSGTSTDPHGSVGVSVTVLDINGKPVPGVATDVRITQQPGVVGEGAVLATVALPDTGDGSSANGDSPAIFGAFLLGALGVVTVAWAISRRAANRD